MMDNYWKIGHKAGYDSAFDNFQRYLNTVNDGTMDISFFLGSANGTELGRRLAVRCRIQNDEKAANAYYHSLDLDWEYHTPENYYKRWKLFYPQNTGADKRYPLVFWNHGGGNSIESEETMTGYLQLAAREKYFFVIAQNTNPVNILRILDEVCKRCPVDTEKIYLAGFSQGANQCHSLYTHYPDRVTAAALTCMDIWRPWDNMDERYTEEELETLKEKTVPLSLQAGMCEPFPYVPLNSWRKNKMNPIPPEMRGSPDDFIHPGKIAANDPTRITTPGKGRIDPFCPGAPRMTSAYIPGADEDVHRWSIERVNKRLELLNCEPLEVEKCISFLNNKENQIRHITGIYGDEEEILNLLEIRHYAVKIKDRQKRTVFQYIATENSPHWPPVTTAELGWDFLKQFRRDTHSGWIVWKEKERNESGNETSKESNHF